MKILVCGGRNYYDRKTLFQTLDGLLDQKGVSEIVHGGARGADRLAGEWAKSRNIPCEVYPAKLMRTDPDTGREILDRNARFERNKRMLKKAQPDLVVAFPGRKGTADMVRQSQSEGYLVILAGHQIC